MKIKSYFATTVEAAMALARQELGADAMLMHSKRTAPESRHLGEYEVVFATESEQAGHSQEGGTNPTDRDPALDRLADDIASMRRQIERMTAALGYAVSGQAATAIASPDNAQAFAALVRAGVHPEIAHEFALRAGARGDGLSESLERIVREEVRTDAWESIPPPQRIAAFIGPPGAGKTTTLAKVAAVYGIGRRVSTQVISCDVHRIAATEQLRTLCSILGIGLQVVETPLALEHALAEHRSKALILIDTPGCCPGEIRDFEDFAGFFASRPEIEKHLVLPASMKHDDLSRIADAFLEFRYTHLVFSKLDETATFGCVVNEVRRTGRPLSFLCTGQEVPEDLEPADPNRVVNLVLGLEEAATREVKAAA
jgi:flagellar biosynthesis protein FlhF